MTQPVTRARIRLQDQQEPIERALMLIALGLNPRNSYGKEELHAAWCRRMDEVETTMGGHPVMVDAINTAYGVVVRLDDQGPRAVGF
jgi:hypothetical protein